MNRNGNGNGNGNGMEWNGMEWIGIEWNGAEWNGMEWNGVHGMEQKLVRKQAEAGAENWERHLKVKPALK